MTDKIPTIAIIAAANATQPVQPVVSDDPAQRMAEGRCEPVGALIGRLRGQCVVAVPSCRLLGSWMDRWDHRGGPVRTTPDRVVVRDTRGSRDDHAGGDD